MNENDLNINTTFEQNSSFIKVMGVGRAGINAVNHMYSNGIKGVDFIVCDDSEPILNASPIITKIRLNGQIVG